MLDHLKSSLTALITKSLNAYLALDNMSKERIQALQGRQISLEFKPFQMVLYFTFNNNGMQIIDTPLEATSFVADTKISGTPLQLFNVMLASDEQQRFFAKDLLIEGDTLVGQQVLELFDEMNIDWEGFFAHYVGDVPAYHTHRWAHRITQLFKKTGETLQHNLNEYIHEEANWLPAKEALNDLFNDIDQIRMDVDRIDAKIKHFQSTIKPSAFNKDKP